MYKNWDARKIISKEKIAGRCLHKRYHISHSRKKIAEQIAANKNIMSTACIVWEPAYKRLRASRVSEHLPNNSDDLWPFNIHCYNFFPSCRKFISRRKWSVGVFQKIKLSLLSRNKLRYVFLEMVEKGMSFLNDILNYWWRFGCKQYISCRLFNGLGRNIQLWSLLDCVFDSKEATSLTFGAMENGNHDIEGSYDTVLAM